MPAGSRVRANNVYGTVSDNPLLIGATSFTSLGLNLLPAIASTTQHAVIVLDPKRLIGPDPEIVIVTLHTTLGTTATITRGAYGTTARQHPQGTAWAHVPVGPDEYVAIVTSGTRPSDPYLGQIIYETDTDTYTGRGAGPVWQSAVPLGAWTSWVPTWTNLTVGSGTVIAKYQKVGRMVNFRIKFTYGAGSAVGTVPTFTLPFTAAADYQAEWPLGPLVMVDNGVKAYAGYVQISSVTQGLIRYDDGAGSFTSITSTVPFSWGSADYFFLHAQYEAVS